MNPLLTMIRGFQNPSDRQLRLKMRIFPALFCAALLTIAGSARLSAADEEGVALAIVYDTSGSMKEPVRDSAGKSTPKYVVANRALIAVAKQIQTFATNSATEGPRNISAGLFTFTEAGAREAIKFGPFDAAAMEKWAAGFSTPSGGTPLGAALRTATQSVLDSPLSRKHVLVITDGENTVGAAPAAVMPELTRRAERKQAVVFVHFVAFDVDAKVFAPVKKMGATVVGAADESQLNTQLDFILQNQILLEKPSNTK
jgi:von Willebrand factor type A domain